MASLSVGRVVPRPRARSRRAIGVRSSAREARAASVGGPDARGGDIRPRGRARGVRDGARGGARGRGRVARGRRPGTRGAWLRKIGSIPAGVGVSTHLGSGILRRLVLRQALVLEHVHQGGLASVVETLRSRRGGRRGRVRGRVGPRAEIQPPRSADRTAGWMFSPRAPLRRASTRARDAPGRGSWRSSATTRGSRGCRRTSS